MLDLSVKRRNFCVKTSGPFGRPNFRLIVLEAVMVAQMGEQVMLSALAGTQSSWEDPTTKMFAGIFFHTR
jgi:hypothetical protein